ncbi:MAG: PAS domain S-box protein [Chloroflexi bacterium]|nr:PAS domain S-box protein [Chloroflexota bacterium]
MAVVNSSTILLATKDTLLRAKLCQELQEDRWQVLLAEELASVLPLCQQTNPQIILLDSRDADYVATCTALRQQYSQRVVLVALVEIMAFDAIERSFSAADVDEVLPVPWPRLLLRRRLRRLLTDSDTQRIDAERYRALFNRALDAVFINDFAGRFIDANDTALAMLGYSHEELLALSVYQVLDSSHHAHYETTHDIVRRDGFYRLAGDLKLIGRDGHTIFCDANFTALYSDGVPTAMLTVAQDVTLRRQIETAEHEQRLLAEALRDIAAALNSTLEMDVVLDKLLEQVARVVPFDCASIMLIESGVARVARHRGFAERGLESEVLAVRIPVSRSPIMQRMIASRQPHSVVDTQYDTEWLPVPAVGALMHGYLGAPVSIQDQVIGFINLDSAQPGQFTQRDAQRLSAFADQAAIAIRNARMYDAVNRYVEMLQEKVDERTVQYYRTRDRLEAILQNSSDAVLVVQTDGHIVQTNRAFDELFGAPQPGVVLQNLVDSIHTFILTQMMQAIAVDNQPRRAEISLRCLDGSIFEADAALYPIVEQDALMTVHVVCSLRDIRQRKQMEISLLQALQREKELSELKSRFVTTVNHEFRTPLAVISIASEMLKKYNNRMTPEQQRQRLEGIEVAVRNMTRLLSDTLTVSRATEGRLELKPSFVDLPALCQKVVEAQRHVIGAQHELLLNTFGTCSQVQADEKLLEQMVEELVINAIKYSPPGSRIELEIWCEPENVTLYVRDAGIGIPAEDRERIFEPFHRASNVGMASGTGLGLAVVQKVVELHHGSIHVESREGAGTTFTIELPQSQMVITGG